VIGLEAEVIIEIEIEVGYDSAALPGVCATC
jgi:hypothetical protein